MGSELDKDLPRTKYFLILHLMALFWFPGVREGKVRVEERRETDEEGRTRGHGRGSSALGKLTLNSPYVDILLLFIFGVSLIKGHECDECLDMSIICSIINVNKTNT